MGIQKNAMTQPLPSNDSWSGGALGRAIRQLFPMLWERSSREGIRALHPHEKSGATLKNRVFSEKVLPEMTSRREMGWKQEDWVGAAVKAIPGRGSSMGKGPEFKDSVAHPGYYKQFSKANICWVYGSSKQWEAGGNQWLCIMDWIVSPPKFMQPLLWLHLATEPPKR